MLTPRGWQILRKDLRVGPRSPVLLWALVVPVIMTLLIRGVFGELFASEPRLGVVDEGASELVAAAQAVDGIEVVVLDDARDLHDQVAGGGLDAGLSLPSGFDAAVRGGERPPLALWLSSATPASDQAVLMVTVLDLVRGLASGTSPIDVEVVEVGGELLPLDLRLLPLLVLYAVAIPGGMVPAASLVEEKERGTFQALLASPATVNDILVAKGLLGVLLGMVAGVVTLLLNDAFGQEPIAVLLAVLVGATMMAEVGLLFGSWARDTNTLFAAWKGGGLVLFLPAVFFLWPDLPGWPARLLPSYYFLEPAYAVGVEGAGFADVAGNLVVGGLVCVALVPAVAAVGRRLQRRLVAGHIGSVAGQEQVRGAEPVEPSEV